MFYSPKRNTLSLLSTAILAFAFLFSTHHVHAQAEGKLLPAREGSVTDFASVIDYNSTKRLENMLANLKERSGLEFAIVTVKTTGGIEIFKYSQRLAREWNIGEIQSKAKSLLL